MTNPKSGTLELLLLAIFKWVVIAAMIVLIMISVGLLGKGFYELPKGTAKPAPVQIAPKPIFSAVDFLDAIHPKPAEKVSGSPAPQPPSTLAPDADEAAFRAHSERLWTHISKYQVDCGLAAPLTKVEFLESLRQTPLKRVLEARGSEFATSQESFAKDMLSNQEIIKLCKSGKQGLFFSILEFHRSKWDNQVAAAADFERRERQRVADFEEAQLRNAAASQASANQSFLTAAIAFGLFMCVALVLIFARLESNLRGVRTIVYGSESKSIS